MVVPALTVDAVGITLSRSLQAQAAGPKLIEVFLESQVRVLFLLGESGRGRRQFAEIKRFLDQELDALTVDAQVGVVRTRIRFGLGRTSVIVARVGGLRFARWN